MSLRKPNDPTSTLREEDQVSLESLGIDPGVWPHALQLRKTKAAYNPATEPTQEIPVIARGQGREDWTEDDALNAARGVIWSLGIMSTIFAALWLWLWIKWHS